MKVRLSPFKMRLNILLSMNAETQRIALPHGGINWFCTPNLIQPNFNLAVYLKHGMGNFMVKLN
jgi:hypothetical protein